MRERIMRLMNATRDGARGWAEFMSVFFEDTSHFFVFFRLDEKDGLIMEDVNDQALTAFNVVGKSIKKEELVGRSLAHIAREILPFSAEEAERTIALYEEAARKSIPSVVNHAREFQGGVKRDMRLRFMPLLDDSGRTSHLLLIGEDLTAEEQRRREMREAAIILENAPLALFRLSFEAEPRILYSSRNVHRLGLSRGTPENHTPFLSLVLEEETEMVSAAFARALEGGTSGFRLEFPLGGKGIEEGVFVEARIQVERDETGRGTAFQAILIDITERRQMEDRLRQSQRLEVIGTLAGGIAHDFNTILAVVLMNAKLALDDLPPELPEDHSTRESLNQILSASNRARDLIQQILTFSRKVNESRRMLFLGDMVLEIIQFLRGWLPSTIEIQHNASPGLGGIFADPTHIHQVIVNLCTNAAHAMQAGGGVLKLKIEEAVLDESHTVGPRKLDPGRYIRLLVCDSGTGMDAAVMNRIFEPFFTTKKSGEGTGMGLAMVHGIVTRLNGAIGVDSVPGRGSEFEVWLPHHHSPPRAIPEPETKHRGGSERILLVDDDFQFASALRKSLNSLGYRITLHTGATRALEEFRGRPGDFDLVITDQNMSVLSGTELARKIKAIEPDARVILCTGGPSVPDESELKEHGLDKLVMKPFSIEEIDAAVREVLDR